MGSNSASLGRSQKVCANNSHHQAFHSFSLWRLPFFSGLAQAAVHKADQTEVIPPSYFATSAATGSGSLSSFMSTLSLATPGSNHVLLPGKRPTFAFHRRIRDDPAFRVELPSEFRQWYLTAMKAVGGAIHNLVQEWRSEWLEGTRSEADAQVRLTGTVRGVTVE